jgi:hypothetical protein
LLIEKIAGPQPAAYTDIPCNYESLTPQWLTAVLCRNTAGAAVTSVRLGRGSIGTSARRRLLIEYNDAGERAGLPTSVFAKGTPNLITRIAGTVSEAMTGEAHFYRLIRPELSIEAPIGYHSAFDLKRGRSIHLIEDPVETKGATFCTPQTRLWRTQAEDIVQLLATLHGTYYESPRVAGDLAPIVRWPIQYGRMVRTVDLKKYHHRGFERTAHAIPESVRRRSAHVWPAIVASTALHDRLPQTIVHCDVHLGNWYTTVGGRMGLLDWQCLARTLVARSRIRAERDAHDRGPPRVGARSDRAVSRHVRGAVRDYDRLRRSVAAISTTDVRSARVLDADVCAAGVRAEEHATGANCARNDSANRPSDRRSRIVRGDVTRRG